MRSVANTMRQTRSKAAIWILAAIIGLAVAGVIVMIRAHGPVHEDAPARTPSGPVAASSTQGLPAAPDIDIVMYQGDAAVAGGRNRLSQLWGKGKPIVLNYFAGLCPPCRGELPDFQQLYTGSAKDKFILIGVDVGSFVGLGSRDDGMALLRDLKITFPAGTIFSSDEFRRSGIFGMPTTAFITSDGRILRKYTGMLTRDQMTAFLAELLKASGTP